MYFSLMFFVLSLVILSGQYLEIVVKIPLLQGLKEQAILSDGSGALR